ncbi:NAD(P)-binding protein [Canariomyces notabilis]|uniref:NAD(P)-binding protein n=1 Tax=Canariomyces notabilis TaxID=2074819 RepID=A0AAN6YSR2_9PEZI|nr:NAD(P)-binding protein [Canariomyces arenarius]
MATPTVYVSSATGQVGGAVARQLRSLGWEVHTTTRNPSSSAAKSLASIGVKVLGGDWTNEAALSAAIAGCTVVFMNLMPDLADIASELKAAETILRIAKAAGGVSHIVYSGAITPSAPPEFGPDHFLTRGLQSKTKIEQAVRDAGFEYWTILRPGYFMTNLVRPKVHLLYPGAAESGVFNLAFNPDTPLGLIDPEDIAAFAVEAFRHPRKANEKVVTLVGETVAVDVALEMVSKMAGRAIRRVYLPEEELGDTLAKNPRMYLQVLMRDLFRDVDVDEAKSWGITMSSFVDFLAREKKEVEDTYRPAGTD